MIFNFLHTCLISLSLNVIMGFYKTVDFGKFEQSDLELFEYWVMDLVH